MVLNAVIPDMTLRNRKDIISILLETPLTKQNYNSEEKNKVKDKMQCGVFQDIQKSGFFEEYEKLVERLAERETRAKGGKK